jgi:very-short-patch-repair endonuclease
MTDAEKRLWLRLRLNQIRGHRFYRQKIIGNYIVDFFCPAARLVIEIDGSQHLSEQAIEADSDRDRFIGKLGYKVLRFYDTDILTNIEGVVEKIFESIVDDKKKAS